MRCNMIVWYLMWAMQKDDYILFYPLKGIASAGSV